MRNCPIAILLVFVVLGIAATLSAAPATTGDRAVVQPFDLRQVHLLDGPFLKALERNAQYLSSLNLDRQLHVFRKTAGLPSKSAPLGGWEAPDHMGRGEFFGHSLSARAMLYAATGDAQWKRQLDYLVGELAKCQKASGASGYLHAEPESIFDRLEAGENVQGIYYPVHKLMAGLLDTYTCCGNQQALEIAKKMADWIEARARRLTPEHWQRILDVEFGGLNEALYDLYAITHDPRHLESAHRFDHEKIYAPLAEGRDALTGLHANTTIPKIIGAARAYEVSGNERFRKIAEYFWRQVAEHRSYATGGTSNHEFWRTAPNKLASELSNETQECCCTYNMLKLTRHVFQWTGDSRAAEFYERGLFNSILGTMNPETGTTMYFVPLAGGYWKTFASPLDSFWCCCGTGVESFSKLADSIYFHDSDSLWVNLFIASELTWPEKGLKLRQETRFPEQQATSLRFAVRHPVELALRLRIPSWATRRVSLKLNGSPLDLAAAPGSYAEIRRTWQDGDRLTIETPMSLRLELMPDDKNTAAILFGPIVLAGCLGDLSQRDIHSHSTAPDGPPSPVPVLSIDRDHLAASIRPSGKPLEFRVRTKDADITLVPLNSVFGKRYAVYWKTASPSKKPESR
jgi:uncharacterized protein